MKTISGHHMKFEIHEFHFQYLSYLPLSCLKSSTESWHRVARKAKMWKIYSCLKLNFAYTFQLTISTYFKHVLKVLSFRKLFFKQFHGMLMKLKVTLTQICFHIGLGLLAFTSLIAEFKGGIIIISQFLTQNSLIFFFMTCFAQQRKEKKSYKIRTLWKSELGD